MEDPHTPGDELLPSGIFREQFRFLAEALNREPTSLEQEVMARYWKPLYARSVASLLPPSISRLSFEEQQAETGTGASLVLRASSCRCSWGDDPEIRAAECISRAVGSVVALGGNPLFISYSRYVGSWNRRGMKKIIRGLARGAQNYGASVKVLTGPGELLFQNGYEEGPIFLAVVLGLVPSDLTVRPVARGTGNPVFLLEPKGEGEDGSFGHEKSRIDVCRDLSQRSYLVGMESVGSGGMAVACTRMAVNGRSGLTLNFAGLPAWGKGETPGDVLFSEAMGRMVVVIARGFEGELKKMCRKGGLRCSRIGEVVEEEVLRIRRGKTNYVSIPLEVFAGPPGDPLRRPSARGTSPPGNTTRLDVTRIPKPKSYANALLELLRSPTILADTLMVIGGKKGVEPVVELPENNPGRKAILQVDGAVRFAGLDPRSGGRSAVMAAARRLVCHGVTPGAALSVLIPGPGPGRDKSRRVKETVRGLGEGFGGLEIPVGALDVEEGIDAGYPAPVVGVAGFLDDPGAVLSSRFKDPDDFILLLGSHRGELGGSEYLNCVLGKIEGPPPLADVAVEHRIHEIVLVAARGNLVKSAHPVSRGGLAVALVQALLGAARGVGVRIHMSSKLRTDELLFGETQGLVIVTIHEDSLIELERICMRMGVPCTAIGRVTDDGVFTFDGLLRLEVREVRKLFTRRVRELVWG
ncbi:MAG: AIR synthase-related protein [Fidelibacterota bacterium]